MKIHTVRLLDYKYMNWSHEELSGKMIKTPPKFKFYIDFVPTMDSTSAVYVMI